MGRLAASAVILAGGKSSRMGRDKALLPFEGKVFLERITACAASVFQETLVIVEARGKTEALDLGSAVIHEDILPGKGPLGGIYTGLFHAAHEVCCVMTCDMPRVDPSFLRKLAGCWREGMETLTYRNSAGMAEPFPGLYGRSCRGSIQNLILEGKFSMQALLRTPGARLLSQPRPYLFANVNTPLDYENFLKEMPA